MKEIEAFHEAIRHPAPLTARMQAAGRKIMGYMCSYAPEELIYAAGFHPMRLFPSGSDIMHADTHLQSYCCSMVKGILEDSLAGRLDFLSGTVFPHTCDSIQRLSDIWRMNNRHGFFADVVLPVKLNTQSARIYMADVLNRFRTELETASGKKINDAALMESIHLFKKIRRHLSEIYALKSRYPGVIKGTDLYALIRGTMVMDRDEAAGLLPVIVDRLRLDIPEQKDPPVRLILSGSVCDFPDLYSLIEDAGGAVVADDLCTGLRGVEDPEVNMDADPVEVLTDRYMNRIICPAKHRGITTRGEYLAELVQTHQADGVVFVLLKFCDPHGFDYPYLKAFLETKNTRTLLLEIDGQSSGFGQLATRLETFIQML